MNITTPYTMLDIAPTVSRILQVRPPANSSGAVIEEIQSKLGVTDRVGLVVIDAFGVSTWQRYKHLTFNFNLLADKNMVYIQSVLPAKTPVNFATMVTGAEPEVHNIKSRTDTLKVETIFHVLSEKKMKSAAIGWEASTVGILLSPLADYKGIASSNTDEEVVKLATEIVKENHPNFLILQLLEVDSTGHKFGLEGEEIKEAILSADKHLGEILSTLLGERYAVLILADHGAHQEGVKATHNGYSSQEDIFVPLTIASQDL